MTGNPELLSDSLRQIADQADPVDLYERSLARSRRITRNRAVATTTAAVALVALSVAGGTVLQRGAQVTPVVPPAASALPTSSPAQPSASPARSTPPTPSAGAPSATRDPVAAGSVPGLPGWLYYRASQSDRVVRLTPAGTVTVLETGGLTATVSPDGRNLAYVSRPGSDDAGTLIVTDRNGKQPRTLLRRSLGAGWEPTWSPDSTHVLGARGPADAPVNGTVDIRTGAFTPLPHNAEGIHRIWSPDGRHLAYATGDCRIVVSDTDGANPRRVPVIGDDDRKANPRNQRSCDPYSLSADGARIALRLRTGNEPDGDIARTPTANAVIDTRTGATIKLPVTGTVNAVLFQPDNSMLIRTRIKNRNQLVLVSPAGAVTIRVAEPAATRDCDLLAYTPN